MTKKRAKKKRKVRWVMLDRDEKGAKKNAWKARWGNKKETLENDDDSDPTLHARSG
jgi:hypothetical protein